MRTCKSLADRIAVLISFLLCTLLSSFAFAATPQVNGEWQNGPNFPFFPVHAHLLPNSNVLIWPGDGGISGDDLRVWNPSTGTITAASRAGYDLFCTGHTFLPDGRLFVAGGHISNGVGLPDASIFNSVTNTWTRQQPMNLGRWYPTTTALPNGDVLVLSGEVDATTGFNPLPQVWQSSTGQWRNLNAAELILPNYPYMFLAPNGLVFNAGPDSTTRYLNTSGTGAWSFVANRTFDAQRDYGSAVMYEPGKILTVGGGDPPTATSEVIDLNAGSPSWRAVGSMSTARRMMNATMLPDGKVFASGGTRGPGFNNSEPGMPVFTSEMWDPATEAWSIMATATVPRLYHSTALLLPDARVLVTGGNDYTQTEIFSPPYLFAGTRPSISSAPSTAGKGQSLFLGTPDATSITGVTWIAIPSVTHTNNMNQGFFRSTSITQGSGGINIIAPNDPTVPAGFYMVFVTRNGVPSIAKIIQLGPESNHPSPTISAIAPTSATAGGPAFSLSVTGSNFVNSSKVRWNGVDRPTTFVSATQLTAAIPVTDIAAAGSAQVSVFTAAPGGGTSLSLAFTINAPVTQNPVPALSSIAPASATSGGAAFTLTATGTNFLSSSKVRWNGSDRTTTYISATQLKANISAVDIQTAGNAQVTVFNPTPGGGTSAIQSFVISAPTGNNPVPILTSLTPASSATGSPDLTVTVNGSSFVTGSKVRWNGADRTTTFVSATQLKAVILAADMATAGTAQVTVLNPAPGGGISSAQAFTVGTAGQNLTALGTVIAKVTAPLGGGAKDIEIIRDGVMPAAGSTSSATQYDTWDGINAASDDWVGYQFTSAQTFNRVLFQEGNNFGDGGWFTTLTVQVRQAGNWVAVTGLTITPTYPGINNGTSYETYNMTFNAISGDAIRIYGAPGGSAAFISIAELQVFGNGTTAPAPAPTISAIAPTSATAGGPAFSLSVTGSNFVNSSKVRWNGVDRPTTFVSATQLTAAIPVTDIAAAGSAQVSVFTAAPGGGTSLSLAFTINAPVTQNPVPALSSIAPASATSGGAAFTLTATGTNFLSSSKVRWNGSDRTTTYISATQLKANISAVDIQTAGNAQVTVFNPTPGGGTSAIQSFVISAPTGNNPVPILTSLTPASSATGSPDLTVTVNGSSFVTGSKVRWNGADRTTTFVSATQLKAVILAADMATAGTAQVTVLNPAPGGGISSAQAFTVGTAGQNLTALGTVIAKVTAPLGGGAKDIEIIRDGVMPAAGSTSSATQYDTWDGINAASDDWVGYQFTSAQTFNRVLFQEGNNFGDGGWFTTLTVQVRQAGNWVAVTGLTITPTYPGINNGTSYETYNMTFNAISGDAIRIYGAPGGSAAFISIAELQVFGNGTTAPAPAPTISAIAPTSATAGGPAFSLSVTGSNFVNSSKVRWNGVDRPTTFVSATQLTAAIPVTDIAAAGSAQVSVFTAAPGGGTSLSLAFTINAPVTQNPVPALSSIAPASATSGGAAFTLTATGTNFLSSSKVRWNGSDRTTTYISATQLKANISAVDIQTAGNAQVTVFNPTPGGGTSAIQSFVISAPTGNNPVPILTSLTPASSATGSPDLTVTVNGSSFVTGSKVRWNGADRTTTFVSATQLKAVILAADMATAGTAQVTVLNPAPGGGISSAQAFTVGTAGQNLTALGTVIAKVTAPLGGGAKDIEIIRDGVMPAAGSTSSATQYDTWDGINAASDDWVGYQFTSAQTFNRVLFQEGNNFGDGGWFTTLTVQVRQAGNWVAVTGLTITPTYPGINNGTSYETYNMTFNAISGDAIRIYGAPGGSAAFISIAELQVFGQ